jgi:hypothetical protein
MSFSFKKFIIRLLAFVAIVYVIACVWAWSNQEKLIFYPEKLNSAHRLDFKSPFEEIAVTTSDDQTLNGALFHAARPLKKLIFFLHGNAGNIENLQGPVNFYTDLGYDFFAFDYRGFGKSTGKITSEEQFYADAQLVYNKLKEKYVETDIVIVGYSIGTATATKLAAENQPEKLALLAPYYSMEDMSAYKYRIFPDFILNYKFETYRFLPQVNMPVILFHGRRDEAIPFYSSKMLAGLLKKGDRFVPLANEDHNGIEQHPVFKQEMKAFLAEGEH